ncbi:MAG TPA: UrcA family protein [Sphingomicrobium sp.]|jgi:UrcA family protein|nr:UrcA family protein [Sphingomicrobium sp.]
MRTITLAACLIITGAASANAQEPAQRIAALSVTTTELNDAKANPQLQDRIGKAVDEVCGTTADTLDQFTDLARCRKSARAAVVDQLGRHSRKMVAARK